MTSENRSINKHKATHNVTYSMEIVFTDADVCISSFYHCFRSYATSHHSHEHLDLKTAVHDTYDIDKLMRCLYLDYPV